MTSSPRRCPGPVSRRSFLQWGTLGMGTFGLADLWRAQGGQPTSRHKSLIFIWLPGGPPHMEMYDMKPDAPSDYRGEFRPIATNVSGLDVCELMPLHAKIADKYTIVRSIAHEFADHGGGHKRFLTGRDPKSPVGFVNDAPMVGSIVAKQLAHRHTGIPNYIVNADNGRHGIDVFSFGSAYLGPETHPFVVPGDPSDKDFAVKNVSLAPGMSDRLADRMRLLSSFDRLRSQAEGFHGLDEFHRRAVDLLTGDKVRDAFDLSKEPQALRERYGAHAWGQQALLARRLVEAGSTFVTMVMEKPYQSGVPFLKQGAYNWDSHAVNCHLFDDARVRLPIYDRAITALVEDLHDRGLTDDVLLVVTGEFGRTPRISEQTGTQTGVKQPGRDHWPQAMSLLVSGGGMQTGQVVGSTNKKGEHPQDRPLTPNDLWASVYKHLGVDYNQSLIDHRGRPQPILPYGEPIRELLPA